MLTLSRANGEGILIGENILIVKVGNKLGIKAPKELNIKRISKEEIQRIIHEKNHPTNQ